MKNSDQKKQGKVVQIEKARKKKEEKGSIIVLLKDTRKTALAIQSKICLLCQTKKLCVNRTGLCSACYNDLILNEKKIAELEAQHKTIEVIVTDDRWDK